MNSSSFDFSAGEDDLLDRGRSRSPGTVATPPLWLLWTGLCLAGVGAVVAGLLPGIVPSALGWLLAGPVALGVLAVFVSRDTSARATGLYTAPAWLNVGYRATVVVSLCAVLLCAVRIAEWVGRL